jgi:capsule polysaccharide export protein KpsE/RkpR
MKIDIMKNYFSDVDFLNIFSKWKWHLLIIALIASVIGLVVSSKAVMISYYKSDAIVYPVNLTPYSDESQAEQMLQWFASRDIMDSVIAKFDLAKHYKVDAENSHFNSIMQRKYEKQVKIYKTRFESVCIEVSDIDPVRAYEMVYAIIDFYNLKVNLSHREKYNEVLGLELERLVEKKQQLDSLNHLLTSLREKYGLIDYGIQANEVTKGYLGTFDGSNSARINMNELQRLKSAIQSKGDSLMLITNLLSSVTASYTNYAISYESARQNVAKALTFATIVSHPVVADKVSFPKRWLIVLYSVLSITFFSLLIIAFIEKGRIDKRSE